MLVLINDSAIEVGDCQTLATSAGGTSAFLSGFINYIIYNKVKFQLIGNFIPKNYKNNNISIVFANSNVLFLLKLIKNQIFVSYSKRDILYFQRPDHAIIALIKKAKVVIHLHGQVSQTINNSRNNLIRLIYNLIEPFALRRANLIIATDSATRNFYIDKYRFLEKKIIIIPTGIDTKFFSSPIDHENQTNTSISKRIIFVGRLAYPKRVIEIIKGFEDLCKTDQTTSLTIVGSGPQKESLVEYVYQANLTDRISFLGHQSKESVKNEIHRSHVAILLSYNEGSPISVKEFLAAGIPVIINPVGDIQEYILDGKTGFVINNLDKKSVSKAMKIAIENANSLRKYCYEMAKNYENERINSRIYTAISKLSN